MLVWPSEIAKAFDHRPSKQTAEIRFRKPRCPRGRFSLPCLEIQKPAKPQRANFPFCPLIIYAMSVYSLYKQSKYLLSALLFFTSLSSLSQTKTLIFSFSRLIRLLLLLVASSIMRRPKASKQKKLTSSKSPEQAPKESTKKASSRGRRAKAPAAPKPDEDEILPDKRNLVRFRFHCKPPPILSFFFLLLLSCCRSSVERDGKIKTCAEFHSRVSLSGFIKFRFFSSRLTFVRFV